MAADGNLPGTVTDASGRVLFSGDLSNLPKGALLGASEADFVRAVAVVIASGKPSTSYIQRQLQIGFNQAAAHIEHMQQLGLVSAPNHAGQREVLDNDSVRDVRASIGRMMAGASIEATKPAESSQGLSNGSARRTEPDDYANPDVLSQTAQGRLKSLIARIERLEEDKAAIAGDLKDVYAEAKGEGFDVKILRKVVRLRTQDKAKRLGDPRPVRPSTFREATALPAYEFGVWAADDQNDEGPLYED